METVQLFYMDRLYPIVERRNERVGIIDKAAKAIDNLKDTEALADEVFSPIDEAVGVSDDSTKREFIELLDKAEEKVRQLGGAKQDWWTSEICLRKGRCAEGVLDRAREYSCWKQAYECAMKAHNHEVVVQSSLKLGFSFVEFSSSIRDIIENQMNCVKAICSGDVATTSRLKIIGINLYDFWRQLEYRRLSEHDLKAKQYIIDSAKSLEKAGFDEHGAAPVMILLIARLFDFEEPCLEWAHMETSILGIPIPENVQRRIE